MALAGGDAVAGVASGAAAGVACAAAKACGRTLEPACCVSLSATGGDTNCARWGDVVPSDCPSLSRIALCCCFSGDVGGERSGLWRGDVLTFSVGRLGRCEATARVGKASNAVGPTAALGSAADAASAPAPARAPAPTSVLPVLPVRAAVAAPLAPESLPLLPTVSAERRSALPTSTSSLAARVGDGLNASDCGDTAPPPRDAWRSRAACMAAAALMGPDVRVPKERGEALEYTVDVVESAL